MEPCTPATDLPADLGTRWKRDALTGVSVSLLALPWCLGLTARGGISPVVGGVAAILAGITAMLLAGASATLRGSSMGLVVIALGAAHESAYRSALGAIVAAGAIESIIVWTRARGLRDRAGSAAVTDALAALGALALTALLHALVGVTPDRGTVIDHFAQLPYGSALAILGLFTTLLIADRADPRPARRTGVCSPDRVAITASRWTRETETTR